MTSVAAAFILSKKDDGENLRDRLKSDHQAERGFCFFLCVGEFNKESGATHLRSVTNKHSVTPINGWSTESTGGPKESNYP